jgi:hypothetical protein
MPEKTVKRRLRPLERIDQLSDGREELLTQPRVPAGPAELARGHLALRSMNPPIAAGIDDFSHLTGTLGLFRKPAHYHVLAESQFGADLEARNFALLDQFVNRGRVEPQ